MGKFLDITGQKFNCWTVIERASNGNAGQTRWRCRCECGKEAIVQGGHLRSGASKNCGCKRPMRIAEYNKRNKTKHGFATKGNHHRLYKSHQAILARCYRPTAQAYHNYGARGIRVCNEWRGKDGFINFKNWSYANGYTDELTIDRIDVNGDYEPSNCRWTDEKTQANNRRTNHLIEIDGETHTISEWADIKGIDQRLISSRIYNGWDETRAVTEPVRKKP